ncbi:bifunctional acetate--CoA ligase family protein/GNAT family N-acetyltransferase [Amycolatopsis sp. H20-H5]|uniref:bifunctional acetate--CoA ligase family protein/GNAT family N-acetyltransferase n=1 Tax=Amycolatopsis sp. H20-H5 TaxID=3046309 RepID=UPI002DBB3502|nr:GNAT family N-acetyltransferase [Amycolatopsis sp. H20-H5]MEC3981676.1 GNAT family N-acetyltransferase [Amycolatopsis sp. H20-H5]
MTAGLNALLADGQVVTVRPLTEADTGAVLALHQGLGERDRYLRFFTLHPIELPELAATIAAGPSVGAFVGSRLAGIANYQPLADPVDAEVALVVDRTVQAHGVGTLLLEHLVSIARRHGVRRFVAEVLAENAKMVRVFADCGLACTISRGGAEREVELILDESEGYLDALGDRERIADIASLRSVLAPTSVAVVGASARTGSVGNSVLRNLLGGGFTGSLHAVNPHRPEIMGVTCVASLADLPVPVELVVICVPAGGVPAVVEECGRPGVRAIVVITSGITGTGTEDLIRETVHRYGIRLVGPNCLGVANTAAAVRLDATFARGTVPAGRVGVVTQSGGVGIALLESLAALGLGISTMVSTGDKYDVSGNDLLRWWWHDDSTDIAVLYLESFGNPRKFSRIARALARRKPVLAVRGAGTAVAQQAAAAHTGAPSIPSSTKDALFAQAGVTVLDTITELAELIAALSWQPLPAGDRVAVVSNAGGAAILGADACVRHGLTLPALAASTLDTLSALLPGYASLANPLDTSAVVDPAVFAACVDAVLADGAVDAVLVAGVPTGAGDPLGALHRPAAEGKPILAIRPGQLESVRRLSDIPGDAPIPCYGDPAAAAAALARMAARARWLSEPVGTVPDLADVDLAGASLLVAEYLLDRPGGGALPTAAGAALMGFFGLSVTEHPRAGRELIVRADSDGTFGPVLTFGLGGVDVDLLDDRAYHVGALTTTGADALIHGLRSSEWLFGATAVEVLDVPAIRDLLLRVAALVALLPEVSGVELTSVVADDTGCVFGQARITLVPRPAGDPYLRSLRV